MSSPTTEPVTILGNLIGNNGSLGINCASPSCGCGHNVIRDNAGGTVGATPLEIGTNVRGTSTTCP